MAQLCIIIPLHNELLSIEPLFARLVGVLDGPLAAHQCHLLFVDDGSTDGSSAALQHLATHQPRVRLVVLSRCFGHQNALTAGLDHAGAQVDAVITMDADLQDPPESLTAMVALWQGGASVVYGVRCQRRGDSLLKRAAAALYYRMMQYLTDWSLPADSGDFRLLDRQVVAALARLPERRRYVRGMVAWLGFHQVALPYVRGPRLWGTSKYSWRRMVVLGIDGLTSCATPVRVGLMWLGLSVVVGLGALGAGLATTVPLLSQKVHLVIAYSVWAAQLTVQGSGLALILSCLVHINQQLQNRPLYIVSRVCGFPQTRVVQP